MINRRTLLSASGGALATSIFSRKGNASGLEFQQLPSYDDERMKMLIATAVDSAKSAGATYADARLTFTQHMKYDPGISMDGRGYTPYNRDESMAFGVRAFVDGYWGFASSPVWTKEEAGRLGMAAVDGAKANFSAKERDSEFVPNPNAESGNWVMPVVDDPFNMDSVEIDDFVSGLNYYLSKLDHEYRKNLGEVNGLGIKTEYNRQQKAFGNTENQYVTQRLFRTGAVVGFANVSSIVGSHAAAGQLRHFNISGQGAGFEVIRRPDIRDLCRALFEELAEEAKLPWIPIDIGRFNCMFHPELVAPLVKKTIGIATEIDRVMGFEANTTGTSYITNPDEELGMLKIGTKDLNVTATRSLSGGLMNVKWDDEGVSPTDVQVVKDGIITDLQSGREGVSWMKGYKQRTGKPLISNGSVYAIDAHEPQVVHVSDLVVHPNQSADKSLTQLREQMEDGLEFKGGSCHMDFQQASGLIANYSAFQIKKGKRIAHYISPGILFRTPELWNSIIDIGGKSSSYKVGTSDYKQSPMRMSHSSVDAPAMLFKDLSVIDPSKKA